MINQTEFDAGLKGFEVIVPIQVSVLNRRKYEVQPRALFFLTGLSVFRNQMMNTFECLNLLLKLNSALSNATI